MRVPSTNCLVMPTPRYRQVISDHQTLHLLIHLTRPHSRHNAISRLTPVLSHSLLSVPASECSASSTSTRPAPSCPLPRLLALLLGLLLRQLLRHLELLLLRQHYSGAGQGLLGPAVHVQLVIKLLQHRPVIITGGAGLRKGRAGQGCRCQSGVGPGAGAGVECSSGSPACPSLAPEPEPVPRK